MPGQKRVAAIHDISGFGKCSLTVALPILSAAGVEACAMPTAILSTHTGGFTGYTYRDMTEDLIPIAEHWKSLNITFDAMYTGYLGSFEQLDMVSKIFDMLKSDNTLIYVDPVMADDGRMYADFKPEFAAGMAKLCQKADIIVPNMTEAAFLLGEEYIPGPYTKSYIEKTLKKLHTLGPNKVVLTGVYFDDKLLGAASYDTINSSVFYALTKRIDGSYHGTGDVFASAMLGAHLRGFELNQSAMIASEFTYESILRTKKAGTDIRFGINFEESIPNYLKSMNLVKR